MNRWREAALVVTAIVVAVIYWWIQIELMLRYLGY
jgi:hypothetical protein